MFEKLGKSRTFLIYDEDEDFKVLAYFSLALQVLKIPDEFSNRQISKLDGFSAKIRGSKLTELPAILIGQLGKNEMFQELLTGDMLMQLCLSRLYEGQMSVGGRIIMLECKDVPYLIEFYGRYGFQKLEKDYEENEYIQMIKILQEDEIIEKDIT